MAVKKIFITGGNGFVGNHLVSRLQKLNHHVVALKGQLEDWVNLKAQLCENQWDVIIHLAGISSPAKCESDPYLAYNANVLGTSLLLEAFKQSTKSVNNFDKTQFIFASTAQIYTIPDDGSAISETQPIKIRNVYGETKLESELILESFSKRNNLKSTVLRLFNHSHISQSTDFFLPSIYHQIKNLNESEKNIFVGDLNIYRDIGTVPDLVNAFVSIVENLKQNSNFEIYNVCSGKNIKLEDLALMASKKLNREDVQFVVDKSRLREGDPKVVLGSFNKLKLATGWEPQVKFEDFF